MLAVPEIRDYARINAEVARLLDAGHPVVRLAGVEGQRLLLARLAGSWTATVEIDGRAGPELAADLNAPGLLVIGRGGAADGLGRGLRAGRVVVLGPAGDAAGYTQSGGVLVIGGEVGHRAGLAISGGTLVLLGPAGRLLGERQSGGTIYALGRPIGPHAGFARRGGALIEPPTAPDGDELAAALAGLGRWEPAPGEGMGTFRVEV